MSTSVENTMENVTEVHAVIGFLTFARDKINDVTGWTKGAISSRNAFGDDGNLLKSLDHVEPVCLIGAFMLADGEANEPGLGSVSETLNRSRTSERNLKTSPYYRANAACAATIIDNDRATVQGTMAVLEAKFGTAWPDISSLEHINIAFNDAGDTTKPQVIAVLEASILRLQNLLETLNAGETLAA